MRDRPDDWLRATQGVNSDASARDKMSATRRQRIVVTLGEPGSRHCRRIDVARNRAQAGLHVARYIERSPCRSSPTASLRRLKPHPQRAAVSPPWVSMT